MKRVHLYISGKVQGVFYRDSTCQQAERIGDLTGWVRNLPEGRVEAEVQGPPDKVDELVRWCHDGSPAAEVEHVEEEAVDPVPDERCFQVRR